MAAAQSLSDRFHCAVVLKGSGTVVAAPQQTLFIIPTGNAKLATAGTGDVLAGMLGARLATTNDAFEAACAAAYQHGDCADKWPPGRLLTASELATGLGVQQPAASN